MLSQSRAAGPLTLGLLCGLPLAACMRDDARAAESAAADQHAHDTVQVTVWEAGLELFVEYDVPEAGEPVRLITHVTYTGSGEPRREGPATFTLRGPDGQSSTHVEPAPARDGTYLPKLVFSSGGAWIVTVTVAAAGAPGQALEVALPPVQVAGSHGDLHGIEVPPAPEGIGFLKEQQWRFGTRIAPLERRPLTERLAVPAVVRAAAERQADVTPPVAGRLEPPEQGVLPHIGDMVAEGQILAYVRPPFSDYMARIQSAQAEIVRSALAVERARSRLARVEALVAEQARSQRELEEARFTLDLAQAEHAAAKAVSSALATSGVEASAESGVRFALRAPISGFVREVSAVSGTYVGVDASVFKVRDTSFVHLDALVRPEALSHITPRDRLLVLRARGAAGPRELSLPEAELVFVGDELDPHKLTVPVLFEVPNPELQLRIRERVEVQLEAREPSAELALPASAIVEENGRPVVFVQLAGETFEKRYVELGFRDGVTLQLLEGLAEGEHVVVEGGYAIRLATLAGGSISHGHAH